MAIAVLGHGAPAGGRQASIADREFGYIVADRDDFVGVVATGTLGMGSKK
ncbi:hypothetical protein QD460_11340 [Rhizobium jaguaris]